MHVVATAGHVDHGKSTLVQTLTGSDPDRLEEEKRRGLSIELGYCWATLEPAGQVAFVDVPGHERFVSTMLAGIGPVPAALLVVAADDPWMPQAAEHLAALDALGVRHGVVAVTRSDLADPAAMVHRAAAEVARTSLAGAPVVPVSGRTGAGIEDLRAHLGRMLARMPVPDPAADVRLWVDRRFTVRGAGTVVTGTLPAGRISVGDTLAINGRPVRVRGMESLGRTVGSVEGVARVALNLAGQGATAVERGSVLLTPDAWRPTGVVDVRTPRALGPAAGDGGRPAIAAPPPAGPMLHVGATSLQVHVRPLSDGLLRLRLPQPLPLRVGDRVLLRDPGSRQVWGAVVLDPAPPELRRRGAATDRATVLRGAGVDGDPVAEVDRRGIVHRDLIRHIAGVSDGAKLDAAVVVAGIWLVSRSRAEDLAGAVEALVTEHDRRHPLDPGVPVPALAERLDLPSTDIVHAVLRPTLVLQRGRVTSRRDPAFPPAVEEALERLRAHLDGQPFAAPTADQLQELGLDSRAVAAAARSGRLLRLAPGVVLLAGADRQAVEQLRRLPQPFTVSQARAALGTSRRVALPLLDHLDGRGWTRRLPDDRRAVLSPRAP